MMMFQRRMRDPILRLTRPFLMSSLFLAGLPVCLYPQGPSDGGLLSIRLEQRRAEVAKTVAQNTVFRSGDILRFWVTTRISGYLYIVERGTSGETVTLFPAAGGVNASNRLQADKAMVVPADGDGWFEVSGPAGFDVIYILLSATPISMPLAQGNRTQPTVDNQQPTPATSSLLPRCDDGILKARGVCIDISAGAAPLAPDAPVPSELTPLAGSATRDIILTNDGDSTTVRTAPMAKLPLIYTFRLAHRN